MTRTAVAAPAAEPFDELFAFIDSMTVRDLVGFRGRLGGSPPSYAEWSIGPGDRHRHIEAGVVTYEGTSGDCPICAYPLTVDADEPD